MAHSLSAQKRIRQNLKRRSRNKQMKSITKGQIKKLRALIAEYAAIKDKKSSDESSKVTPADLKRELQHTYKILDKIATSRIFHHNKADRLKSRLTLAVNKVL